MSYCRWSSDDFRSDVYVYESMTGWVIEVARNRVEFDRKDLPADIAKRLAEIHIRASFAKLIPIGLPHDGARFQLPTPHECAAALEDLEQLGYHVPDGVIETLSRHVNPKRLQRLPC